MRPLERVEAEIVELASQVTAATARLVALIGEFDAAEGWRSWGMKSTAHWLSWHTGIGLHAAREQVRVARSLRDLPGIAAAFGAGRLSYSKVRALTRFATADTETDLVTTAEHATGAQIEQLAASMRKARRACDVRARRKAAYVRWHQDDDGSIVGSFRLAPEQAAVFCHGLDAARGRLVEVTGEDEYRDRDEGEARSAADGLVAMAESFLRNVSAGTSPDAAERFQLVLHTSATELARPDDADDDGPGAHIAAGNGRTWRVAPATARRLSCDCPASTMVDGPDGTALHLGRRTRRIRGRLRRAVHHRDRGRCRTPGCGQPATQIHHLRHWAHGGMTCLANLVSVCDQHHWLLHEGGFSLAVRAPGQWVLIGPDGLRVGPQPTPHQPSEPLPADSAVAPDAVTGQWDGSRLRTSDLVGALVGYDSLTRDDTDNVPAGTPSPETYSPGDDIAIDYSTIPVNRFTT